MFFSLDQLRSFAARPCLLWHREAALSYGALADAAEEFAADFAARLPAGRHLVAIEMAAEPPAIAAHIGALASGHAVLPLPAGDPATARTLAARFRPAFSYRKTEGCWQLHTHDHAPAALHPDLALLLQTSGSTGQGRGVRLSRGAVSSNAEAIAEYLRIGGAERAALILPLHYSYGLSVLHSHLARGASLWLAPGSVLSPGFAAALAESGATSLAGVPHHFRLLEAIGGLAALPAGLGLMTVAGGAMPPREVRDWSAGMAARGGRFVVMYGQTEATARIAWLPPEQAAAHPDAVGIAIPGGTLALCDARGREIAAPVAEGELVYRGPNVMMGYATDHADLARGPEITTLATGDLARRDAAGLYRIVGRCARFSKIGGLRIGHDALERALADTGRAAAVWGDDRTIAIRVEGAAEGVAAEAARLTGLGARHFRVSGCRELPRRGNGKIDYPALKAEAAAPQPAPEAGVRAAFRAAFGRADIGPDDSFAGLGGDSLRHVELTLALDERLGAAPEGWERMRIAELERARPAAAPGLPTAIVARALAILAVVTAHQIAWPLYGGAAAMVMLMGMSVAEYRWPALRSGDLRGFLAPMAAVLVPYYAILAGYALAWGQIPWASVFLLGNFALTVPETHLMLPYLYWFIEAYVQMTLLVALAFLLPPLRRLLAGQGRCAIGLGLLLLAVALRLSLPELWPMDGRAQFTLPWVFHLFALGWCIAAAGTPRRRRLVLAAACVILPLAAWLGGNWHGGWIKYMSLLGLVALLLYLPRIRLPRRLVRPLTRLAQAAFPIYLLHRFVPELLMPLAGIDGEGALVDAIAIAGGLALGLAAAALQRQAPRFRACLSSISQKWTPILRQKSC